MQPNIMITIPLRRWKSLWFLVGLSHDYFLLLLRSKVGNFNTIQTDSSVVFVLFSVNIMGKKLFALWKKNNDFYHNLMHTSIHMSQSNWLTVSQWSHNYFIMSQYLFYIQLIIYSTYNNLMHVGLLLKEIVP